MLKIVTAVLWIVALLFALVGGVMLEAALTDIAIVAAIGAGSLTFLLVVERAMTVVVTVVALYADDVPVAALKHSGTVDDIIEAWGGRLGDMGVDGTGPQHAARPRKTS